MPSGATLKAYPGSFRAHTSCQIFLEPRHEDVNNQPQSLTPHSQFGVCHKPEAKKSMIENRSSQRKPTHTHHYDHHRHHHVICKIKEIKCNIALNIGQMHNAFLVKQA